jgi:hypothetical protein
MFTQRHRKAYSSLAVLVTVISLIMGTTPAGANILISNTVLGTSVTAQDSSCGWLVLASNANNSPATNFTVDLIFSLGSQSTMTADQPLIGGASTLNILIVGNSNFKRVDVDYGGTTTPFYLQGGAAFARSTTYHLAFENNGSTTRLWINGVALTTSQNSTGVNLSASQSKNSNTSPITQIGNFLGSAHGGFQGTMSYARIDSSLVYTMTDTVTMTSTLTAGANTKFLLSPSTSIPTYSLITAASYSGSSATFTGRNNFAPGDLITVKNSTAPAGYAVMNATVTAATNTTFNITYASNPGTWATGNLGAAVTTTVTKDDTGGTAITWYDGVCSTATGAPGIVVILTATIGLAGGGNTAIYRVNNTLQVPMAVAGKISFYQQGKVIAGCKNIYFAVGTATCIWKPTQHGVANLTAILNPTDKTLVTTVPGFLQLFVVTRTSIR